VVDNADLYFFLLHDFCLLIRTARNLKDFVYLFIYFISFYCYIILAVATCNKVTIFTCI